MSDRGPSSRKGAGGCAPTLPLALVGLLLGAAYGFAIASKLMPTLEILASAVTGVAMALCVTGFWRLLSLLASGEGWVMRTLRGAVAALLAVPCAAFLATVVVLALSDPETAFEAPEAMVELGVFMMRLTAMHLALLTLPTAALAGAATVRWCDRTRPAGAAG